MLKSWGAIVLIVLLVALLTVVITVSALFLTGVMSPRSSLNETSTWPNLATVNNNSYSGPPCSQPPFLSLASQIRVPTGSSTILTVRFCYFGSPALDFNPLDQISLGNFQDKSVGSGFSISSQPSSNITIGGPSNQGEGTIVSYSIKAESDSPGVYSLWLGWIAPQISNCETDFFFVVGNLTTTPLETYCQSLSDSGSQTSPYPTGYLFAEVVGYKTS